MNDETQSSATGSEEEHERALREQIKRLRVADLAYEMMVGLVTVGYQKLGLTEQTRELRDLDDAHTAIELLRATLSVMEREGEAEDFKDLRSTLAQMQLGYVQAVRSVEEGSAAAAEQSVSASEEPEAAADAAEPDASMTEAAPDSE
ncbi:MAG TPA: hypothetical protein VFH61_13735 [Thermoleophilia bacterium]|nr:hypothetical protein [Thermoleophilia bacterium]